MSNWKSVIKEPPTEDGSYIICTRSGKVCAAHYYTGARSFSGFAGKHAVYWMPLPEPPAECLEV